MSQSIEGSKVLDKALDVIEAVGSTPAGLSQRELADQLGLPRSTVYRLLSTLLARDLLWRDPVRRVYCLGVRWFKIAGTIHTAADIQAAAALEMRQLRDLTGETSYLATLDGLDALSLGRCEGAHSLRSTAMPGQRKPIYCTSQGKAILATLPKQDRDCLMRELTLKPITTKTIIDRRRLNTELRLTAERGYALDDEENVLGIRCVGAAIIDVQGQVRGAISVAGPAYRLTQARLALLGPEVADAARRIGAQLHTSSPSASETDLTLVPGRWAFHGAHSQWHTPSKQLFWADVLAPALHITRQTPLGAFEDQVLLNVDQPILGLLVRDNELLLIQEQGAFTLSLQGQKRSPLPWPKGVLQALCLDSHGRIWAAMQTRSGCVVGEITTSGRLNIHWHLNESLQDLCWHPSQNTLYVTAPESGSILILNPAQPAPRRLASIPKGSGTLSGLVLDAQGGVWTALRNGWSVVRLSPDGAMDRVIGLPVPCPTALALSHDERLLFVVSARQPVALDTLANAPLSGRVFRLTLSD